MELTSFWGKSMTTKYYYFSLQYSAIQQTILRHDRLWSMAGISALLSELNEIRLPAITYENGGTVLVAGGGKFTARFCKHSNAVKAKLACIKAVSTTFPMLEFQVSSEVVKASSLSEAKTMKELNDKPFAGLVMELGEQKRAFRGFGVVFNPHVALCDECGKYPVTRKKEYREKKDGKWKTTVKPLCEICFSAREEAGRQLEEILEVTTETDGHSESSKADSHSKGDISAPRSTTIEEVYTQYYKRICGQDEFLGARIKKMKIPFDFEDIFALRYLSEADAEDSGERNLVSEVSLEKIVPKKRMAVFLADINSMNGKVPVWLDQNEDEIYKIFGCVKSVFVEIAADGLARTFNATVFQDDSADCLPFRVIIAGGDDLCIVMDEKYILDFTMHFSDALNDAKKRIANESDDNHERYKYLNIDWLMSHRRKSESQKAPLPIKPYGFGAAFVISNTHTPFKTIHEVGEELMSRAKIDTCRWDNSINWRIMADEHSQSERLFTFMHAVDKPMFIGEIEHIKFSGDEDRALFQENAAEKEFEEKLSFRTYSDLLEKYGTISNHHIFQILKQAIRLKGDAAQLERWMMILDSEERDKSFSPILKDPLFRPQEKETETGKGKLRIDRLITFFELLSIKRSSQWSEEGEGKNEPHS